MQVWLSKVVYLLGHLAHGNSFFLYREHWSLKLAYLRQVGALCAPHGCRAQSEDDGPRDEGVEGGVELGSDVGGVAEHADHHGPLALEALDDGRGQEHAGDHQGGVDDGQGPGAEASILGTENTRWLEWVFLEMSKYRAYKRRKAVSLLGKVRTKYH